MQGQQVSCGKCCNLCMYEIKWGLKATLLGEDGNKSKVMKHGKEGEEHEFAEKEEKAGTGPVGIRQSFPEERRIGKEHSGMEGNSKGQVRRYGRRYGKEWSAGES